MMEKKLPSRIRRKRNIKIKKSTIGMFVTVFAFVFALFRVFAGENPNLVISHEAAAPGDENVTLYVDLEHDISDKAYQLLSFTVNFDPDKLEYVDDEDYSFANTTSNNNNGRPNFNIAGINTDNLAEGKLLFYYMFESRTVSTSNRMAEITFNVKDDASGKLDVTFSDVVMGIAGADGEDDILIPVDWDDGYIQVDVPVENVDLEKNAYELNVGDTEEINVIYSPLNTTDVMDPNYVSDNEDVATVSPEGVITAHGRGHATITVTAFGREFYADVDVVQHITEVNITGAKHEIAKEEVLQLTAAVVPEDNDDDDEIYWSSSDETVATVDQTGKVTGIKGGQTIITAGARYNDTTDSFEVTGTYEVNVVVPITSFTATVSELEMTKNDEPYQIDYTVAPADNTENKTITWTTNNDKVATVSPDGVIAPVGGGTATITGSLGETINSIPDITIDVTVIVPLESIELDKESIELVPEQTQELHATINPSDTSDTNPVVWTSSNDSIATVEDGVVTAVAPGNATITVTKGSKSDTVSVHVLKPIEGIVISEPEVTLNRNENKTLSVIITPEDAEEDKTVTWSSSDPESVSVDQTGKITGLKGTQSPVTITAELPNGKKATASVTVVVLINDISLNKTSTTLNKGENETLIVSIDPKDTSEPTTVTWESGNDDVATVDANGKVTAVGAGTTTISATVGTHTKNCTVTVLVPITSVEITESDFSLSRGANKTLHATVNPSDTTEDTTITWSSSNTTVAEVDQSGKVIAKAAGEATIKAKAGNKEDTVKVTVIVPITEFTVGESTASVVKGRTVTLHTTINPSDTTEDKTITWTTGNANIATVENGVVTGVGEGTTTIRGTLPNDMYVETAVTVTIIPVESIAIDEENDLEMLRKGTKKLTVSYLPEDATEVTDVVWSSSDEGVATVDSTGLVTAVAEGSATITARMGQLTDTIDVEVSIVEVEGVTLENNSKEAEVGKDFKLTPSFEPNNATETEGFTFTYESSDPEIATVDSEGNVTTKKAGTVKITIKASNGVDEFEDTIEITVKVPSSPKTGVTPIWVYGGIFIILLAIGLVIYKKKELF